ncbi:TRC40/GET3/ArsA family transport-energizing ATPase [Iamia sp. SCSIO 61187]|uniref:ArsA family ATPase n=1 Tax=Iamia sp. SCSIO 61187 TaxID=2722752 RepID=UPI001C62F898|nr:ArsA family ATPase [Iamia sp. SCSIO 61187]QYG92760.1 TRC40/GET3/ArsA family transport-energizing ATPase [Iamia sp. SCSIO 61187]
MSGGRPGDRASRTLLFTGKGGVGKTTVAAATAVRCADAGARTIVLSTDPAHSLADSLDVELGSHPTPVVDGLWGQQLDARERMEESWGDIKGWLADVFEWAGVDGVEAEELALLPGLEEVFGLVDIKGYVDGGEWDVIVVDCAPTAETIRLLSLPDVLRWYMERVFPTSRRLHRAVGPVLSRVTSLPVAGDAVFGSAERFYARLDGVKEILADTERTSVRLVVNPERMVVAEARRTATYLSLFGYGVDAVVANRLLPDGITDPWFDRWKESHAEHLTAIDEGFAPLPVLRADLAGEEVVGLERLRAFGAALYGEQDPATRLHDGSPLRIETRDADVVLLLDLPFADHDELDLGRHADELIVTVGPYRRAIVLPDSLRGRSVTGAKLDAGTLTVTFGAARPPTRRSS